MHVYLVFGNWKCFWQHQRKSTVASAIECLWLWRWQKRKRNSNQSEREEQKTRKSTLQYTHIILILNRMRTSSHSYAEIKILLQIYCGLLSRVAFLLGVCQYFLFVDFRVFSFICKVYIFFPLLPYSRSNESSELIQTWLWSHFHGFSRTLKDLICKYQVSLQLILCSNFNSICQVNKNPPAKKKKNWKHSHTHFSLSLCRPVKRCDEQ